MPKLFVRVTVTQFSSELGHGREEEFAEYQFDTDRKYDIGELAASIADHAYDEMKWQVEQEDNDAKIEGQSDR